MNTKILNMKVILSFVFISILVNVCFSCNSYSDYCDNSEIHENDENDEDGKMRVKREVMLSYEKGALARTVSKTLDKLFVGSGYDRRLRPGGFTGGPNENATEVEVNIAIRSMGPLDDAKEQFFLDCYFRQSWNDPRLKFNSTLFAELAMNWQFLYTIWRPDTFFMNGKRSYLHKVSVPNRFIRIAPTGRVSYSQRLTISARCKMDLRKFPLDSQICRLEIGSFGHNIREVTYKWASSPLSMDTVGMAQHVMVNWSHGEDVKYLKNGNRSMIYLTFQFDRTIGFYILQIYVPLTIIVLCSWVSFLLEKTEKGQETPARTALGATTNLAVVTIGFGGKTKPQVGYATALDVFIIICFISVFCALVEFALINFIDLFIRRMKHRDLEKFEQFQEMTRTAMRPVVDLDGLDHTGNNNAKMTLNLDKFEEFKEAGGDGDDCGMSPEPEIPPDLEGIFTSMDKHIITMTDDETMIDTVLRVISNNIAKLNCLPIIRKSAMYNDTTSVIHSLDRYSRKIFPATFFTVNLIYWLSYLYIL